MAQKAACVDVNQDSTTAEQCDFEQLSHHLDSSVSHLWNGYKASSCLAEHKDKMR